MKTVVRQRLLISLGSDPQGDPRGRNEDSGDGIQPSSRSIPVRAAVQTGKAAEEVMQHHFQGIDLMNNVPSVTASTGRTICRLFAGILCMVSLPSCELAQSLTSPSGQPTVTITPNSAVRDVGETQQFTAQVTGGNSSEASASTVEWLGDKIARLAGNSRGREGLFTCADVGSGTVFAVYRTGVLDTTEIAATATLVCLRPDPPPTRQLIALSPGVLAFTISTGCTPGVIGTIQIRNIADEPISLNFVSDHPAINPFVGNSSLQPGGTGNLGVMFNCSVREPFETDLHVRARTAAGALHNDLVRIAARSLQ